MGPARCHESGMTRHEDPAAQPRAGQAGESREDRLARQLRENLKRRKAQARALQAGADDGGS